MAWVFPTSTSTRDVVVDSYSEQESTTTCTINNMRRRSWLSISSSIATTPTTTTMSHRSRSSSSSSSSSNDSSSYAYGSTPKPHKANEAAWESMRRLRRQVNKENMGGLGLEHFKLIRRVGSGDLGTVYLCQIRKNKNNNHNNNNNNNNMYFAMKVVDREALAVRNKLGRAQVEREILCMLDHPFLPTLYADFQASHYSCLVMEFCPGGDLYSARLKQPSKRFSLSATKFYAAEVILAIEYLHMMGIIYRDLKPENVLVREDGHIMLSDFDLCLKCDVDVVPKLLIKQNDDDNNNKTTSSSSSSSNIAAGASASPSSSCVGPLLRPVLTSCLFSHPLRIFSSSYSRRKRRSNYSVTTITEQANYNNCTSSVSVTTTTSTTNTTCSDSWGTGLTAATELVAEPIEARSKSFVGTHEYLAPEVISGQGHGSPVDWWTFGVFLYEMLFGVTPFKGQNNDRTLRNILKQPLTFPSSTTTTTTTCTSTQLDEEMKIEMEIAKDLIRRLLVKNPKKRIGSFKGSVEIKKHDFFQGVNWALIRSVKPPVVPAAPPILSSHKHNHNKLPPNYYSNNKIYKQYKSTSTLTCHRLQHPHAHHFDYF